MLQKIIYFIWEIIRRFSSSATMLKQSEHQGDAEGQDIASSAMEKIAILDAKKAQQDTEHFQLIFPVPGRRVTNRFGWRTLAAVGKNYHKGVDVIGRNYNVICPEDMVITNIRLPDKTWPVRFKKIHGKWVDLIRAGKIPKGRALTPYIEAVGSHTKTRYYFKHVKPVGKITKGRIIQAADLFCKYANLGYSQGAHLHLETWEYVTKARKHKFKHGLSHYPEPIDPLKYFKKHGV